MSTLRTMYAAQTNSPHTTTLGEISATDTTLVVEDASVLPSNAPFLLTLGYDKSSSETVVVTSRSGNTLTIVRGLDGHALLWVAGTKCARVLTAKDINDIQSNIQTLNAEKQENITAEGILKGDGNGGITAAQKGVDYCDTAVSFEVILAASDWSNRYQKKSNPLFIPNGYVYIVAPVPSNYVDYSDAGVLAENVTVNGEITFKAEIEPTTNLTVTVIRLEAT